MLEFLAVSWSVMQAMDIMNFFLIFERLASSAGGSLLVGHVPLYYVSTFF